MAKISSAKVSCKGDAKEISLYSDPEYTYYVPSLQPICNTKQVLTLCTLEEAKFMGGGVDTCFQIKLEETE